MCSLVFKMNRDIWDDCTLAANPLGDKVLSTSVTLTRINSDLGKEDVNYCDII